LEPFYQKYFKSSIEVTSEYLSEKDNKADPKTAFKVKHTIKMKKLINGKSSTGHEVELISTSSKISIQHIG